jgi:iron complex outermembrane receptor protein
MPRTSPVCLRVTLAIPLLLACSYAVAEQDDANSIFTLGTLTVMGKQTGSLAAPSVLTSVDMLDSTLVEKQNVDTGWELFRYAPGVQLTDFNQGTTSGKLSFRGFNGEGEINAVKFLIDGIPSNSNDGNMPYIDLIFPLDIRYVEVVRGTNDPRYGLYNIAGNVNINTYIGGDHSAARASFGSYNSADVQLAKGIKLGSVTQDYFVAYRQSDGYRDHSKLEKFSLAGKWFYNWGSSSRVGLIARHHQNDAQEPGYLTFAQSREDPEQSRAFSATDGGEREISQFSLHLDTQPSDALAWSTKAYANQFDDTRFIKFSAGVSQQERVTEERHFGALTTLTYRARESLSIEGGLDFQHQDNKSLRYLTIERARQSQTRDQDFELDIYGAYVQAVIKPTEKLKFVPAFRVDKVDGEFTNKLAGTTFDANDYGLIKQPKISAVFSPTDAYSLYANWGRTFQVGVGASTYLIPPRVTDLDPSINDGWELGVKLNPVQWIEARVAYWQQEASGEERRRLNDPSNESDNIGETKRRGVDFQIDLRPGDKWNVWLAYAQQKSTIVTPDPSSPATKGKEIDHVPHYIFTGGVDYQANAKLRFSLSANGHGDYFLERTNSTGKFGGHYLLNAGLSYQITKAINLDFQVKNLTDRYWEYVWHDGAQSLHSPGDRRAYYASVSATF